MVNGDVAMTSGADRRATGDKATVDQQADTILLTGSVVAIQGRNQLKGERLFVERATGKTQLTSPGAAGEDPGRITTRFYRGQENSAQTAKEKVKQLAAEAAKAVDGTMSVFKTDPTARSWFTALMNRRFIGNATSTPMLEMTMLKIIACHHGTMVPVTIM